VQVVAEVTVQVSHLLAESTRVRGQGLGLIDGAAERVMKAPAAYVVPTLPATDVALAE